MSSSYTQLAAKNLLGTANKDKGRKTSLDIEDKEAEHIHLALSPHIPERTYCTFEEKKKSFPILDKEKVPKKSFARVYIWKAKVRGDHNKSMTGHASMQLFTADRKKIPFEENGYISIYPGNPDAHYTLLLTPSYEKKISPADIPIDTILLKETGRTVTAYWEEKRELKHKVLDLKNHDLNILPLFSDIESGCLKKITSGEDKPLVDKIVAICGCQIPSRRKITYKEEYNSDCNASITKARNPPDYIDQKIQKVGSFFKKDKTLPVKAHETYEIHDIDIAAIQKAFMEFREGEQDGWKLCYNRKASYNCSELIARLLIINGKLNIYTGDLESPEKSLIERIESTENSRFCLCHSGYCLSCSFISVGLLLSYCMLCLPTGFSPDEANTSEGLGLNKTISDQHPLLNLVAEIILIPAGILMGGLFLAASMMVCHNFCYTPFKYQFVISPDSISDLLKYASDTKNFPNTNIKCIRSKDGNNNGELQEDKREEGSCLSRMKQGIGNSCIIL